MCHAELTHDRQYSCITELTHDRQYSCITELTHDRQYSCVMGLNSGNIHSVYMPNILLKRGQHVLIMCTCNVGAG